jgi:short chain dehydrogenase
MLHRLQNESLYTEVPTRRIRHRAAAFHLPTVRRHLGQRSGYPALIGVFASEGSELCAPRFIFSLSADRSTTMATQFNPTSRRLSLVTGASSGIGRELAILAARDGFDLIVAADTSLDGVTRELKALGAEVTAVDADLATRAGCDAV